MTFEGTFFHLRLCFRVLFLTRKDYPTVQPTCRRRQRCVEPVEERLFCATSSIIGENLQGSAGVLTEWGTERKVSQIRTPSHNSQYIHESITDPIETLLILVAYYYSTYKLNKSASLSGIRRRRLVAFSTLSKHLQLLTTIPYCC